MNFNVTLLYLLYTHILHIMIYKGLYSFRRCTGNEDNLVFLAKHENE